MQRKEKSIRSTKESSEGVSKTTEETLEWFYEEWGEKHAAQYQQFFDNLYIILVPCVGIQNNDTYSRFIFNG